MQLILNTFFDFFLPRFCTSCNTKLPADQHCICTGCYAKIKLAEEDRLSYEFQRKFFDKKIITDFISLYVFEKDGVLQDVIHAMKYENRFLSGEFLGKKIGENLAEKIKSWEIDFIIPIPLHHLKKAERGFNQSHYIAKGLSALINSPEKPNVIKRVKYTKSQTTMTLKERERNVGGAFKIKNEKIINGKNILLVDDVITTGATISECGSALLKGGANKVYACSAAIANF